MACKEVTSPAGVRSPAGGLEDFGWQKFKIEPSQMVYTYYHIAHQFWGDLTIPNPHTSMLPTMLMRLTSAMADSPASMS